MNSFTKSKIWLLQQQNLFKKTAYLLNPLFDEVWSWTTYSVELVEYACTQSYFPNPFFLDCKNSEDCTTGSDNDSDDDDDYEYEEPDLFGGVEGVDYGIVYGRGDNTMNPEAEE